MGRMAMCKAETKIQKLQLELELHHLKTSTTCSWNIDFENKHA
jgi:hypothetical protein